MTLTVCDVGVMMMSRWMIYCLFMGLAACSVEVSPSYQDSSATYEELNETVGCKSRYVEEKKNDIFQVQYKDHWMTWRGTVLLASAGEVFLNMDEGSLPDLHLTFFSPKGGYDLQIGTVISVKFLMSEAGGCLIPYEGRLGTVVETGTKLQYKQVMN